MTTKETDAVRRSVGRIQRQLNSLMADLIDQEAAYLTSGPIPLVDAKEGDDLEALLYDLVLEEI